MQDEVNEKVVSLAIKTSKLTAEVLQKAMNMNSELYDAMCAYAYQYGSGKYSASGAVERFKSLIEGR